MITTLEQREEEQEHEREATMSTLGKCARCGKTTYSIEGFKVGPPNAEQVYHKGCFKCQNEGCTWQLNLTNYKFYDGKAYCKNHSPVTGFSNVENGQNVRVHGTVGSAAIHVDRALNAPKLDTVNEQIRAPVTSNQYGVGAMTVQTAINAPKRDVVNEQVRGARE